MRNLVGGVMTPPYEVINNNLPIRHIHSIHE